MFLDEFVHSAPPRENYVVLGVVRSTGVGTVISRRGAELFAMKEHFRGRCLMLIVFTLRPCASARKQQFAWILLRTVCSGRSGGLQSKENYFAQSFLLWMSFGLLVEIGS